MELCILASGSTGNCSVVRTPRGCLLIDAGLGPRSLGRQLDRVGVRLTDVAGVCLTHLDSDHCAMQMLAYCSRVGLPIFCDVEKTEVLRRLARRRSIVGLRLLGFGGVRFEPLDGLHVEPVPVAHDGDGAHAFVLQSGTTRLGFATDLGRVPEHLVDRFCADGGLDVLAIESNYCPQMQLASSRPGFLKHRIMGGAGHLSNKQAFDAVRHVLNRHRAAGLTPPASVVLLHRSQECNCPNRVRELFCTDRRLRTRLVLSEPHEPTGWLRIRTLPVQQLTFAW